MRLLPVWHQASYCNRFLFFFYFLTLGSVLYGASFSQTGAVQCGAFSTQDLSGVELRLLKQGLLSVQRRAFSTQDLSGIEFTCPRRGFFLSNVRFSLPKICLAWSFICPSRGSFLPGFRAPSGKGLFVRCGTSQGLFFNQINLILGIFYVFCPIH